MGIGCVVACVAVALGAICCGITIFFLSLSRCARASSGITKSNLLRAALAFSRCACASLLRLCASVNPRFRLWSAVMLAERLDAPHHLSGTDWQREHCSIGSGQVR